MGEKPGDASGDIYAIFIAVGLALAILVVLGVAGFFYQPAWAMLGDLFHHLAGQ